MLCVLDYYCGSCLYFSSSFRQGRLSAEGRPFCKFSFRDPIVGAQQKLTFFLQFPLSLKYPSQGGRVSDAGYCHAHKKSSYSHFGCLSDSLKASAATRQIHYSSHCGLRGCCVLYTKFVRSYRLTTGSLDQHFSQPLPYCLLFLFSVPRLYCPRQTYHFGSNSDSVP